MTYQKEIKIIYTKCLGKAIKRKLSERNIRYNQVGYTQYDGKIYMISETAVSQIIKGKRNITFESSIAFQETLNYKTPKEFFFSDTQFCFNLINEILYFILTKDEFSKSLLYKVTSSKIIKNSDPIKSQIEDFIQLYKDDLLYSIVNFIPDFPSEVSSFEISEKITDWLSDLACFLSQI